MKEKGRIIRRFQDLSTNLECKGISQKSTFQTEKIIRIIFCGGRNYSNEKFVMQTMTKLVGTVGYFVVVHGACQGADRLVDICGRKLRLGVEAHPADWEEHGRAAGPMRNKKMLDKGADLVVAFPGGKGTANMTKLAIDSGVDVLSIGYGKTGIR